MNSAWRQLAEACGMDDEEMEEGPPPIPPSRPGAFGPSSKPTTSTNIGAGVTSRIPGAGQEPIRLTIGRKQMEFSPEEFVDMIEGGQLQGLVAGGQVRKLPGI